MNHRIPPSERQALVDAYPNWYHEIDFGDGVRSTANPPAGNNRFIWQENRTFLDQVDFAGKSVLDIGCWDGMWSFYAEQRGAASVLATDQNTQRWGATRGFEIAHGIFDSKVTYQGDVDIYHAVEKLEGRRFDIVLFLGVYYHLTHAVYAFTQLRHLVNPGGRIIIEGSGIDDTEHAYADFLCGEGPEPERIDASNWTIPSRRWLRDVLTANYFTTVREAFPFKAPRGRILVEATPFEGENTAHYYTPPFGLNQYDPRWRTGGEQA